MFDFLCKRLVHNVMLLKNPMQNQLGFFQTIKSFSSSSKKSASSLLAIKEKKKSFRVSYLMNSCGLSLENAITASKKVHFETPHKPDSVLRLLRNHGFTNAQIAQFVRLRPKFLTVDPEKTLLPKLEFFRSIGLSATVLSKIISSHPSLLGYSLDNHMIPFYTFIKSIVNDDKKVAIAVKNYPRILQENLEKKIAPNVAVLRDHGVPASCISFLLTSRCGSLAIKCDKFEKCVKEVIEMGFKSSTFLFVVAFQIIAVMTESTWNRKLEVYRRWGWSETEFRGAFRSFPILVNLSETKITSAMEFLVNKMGLKSAAIARNPNVLGLSLEKRIIPRCSLIKILLLKGLIKNFCISTSLCCTEKVFLDRFVTKYERNVPELLSIYQEKMRIPELK